MLPNQKCRLYKIPEKMTDCMLFESECKKLVGILSKKNGLIIEAPKDKKERTKSEIKNVLIVRLDVLGDLVCSTALIREIRRNCSKANIVMIANNNNIDLLKNCPYIDELVQYESQKDDDLFCAFRKIRNIEEKVCKFLESSRFKDTIFDFVVLPRSILGGAIGCIDELMIACYCKHRECITQVIDTGTHEKIAFSLLSNVFPKMVYQSEKKYETEYQLEMLEKRGFVVQERKNELWICESDRHEAKCLLSESVTNYKLTKMIAIGVVGSSPVQNWDISNFRKLIKMINKHADNYTFLILGGREAVEAAKDLSEGIENCVNLAGKTSLLQVVSIIDECIMYIGVDTGLSHIADALGKKRITLFRFPNNKDGKTSFWIKRWGSQSPNSVNMHPLHNLENCYTDCKKKFAHCINQISPEEVLEQFVLTEIEKY